MTNRYLVFLFLALSLFFISGCGKTSSHSQELPQSSPQAKDPLTSTIKAGEEIKGSMELVVIQKAIETFQNDEGRNPATLEELVEKSYLKILPHPPVGKYFQYDSEKGVVQLIQKSP